MAFFMDGSIAKLDQICELAEKYNALVMVDDSHAVGFIGLRDEELRSFLVLKIK